MLPNLTDTICAVATPPGVGAISVIRLSGPDTMRIVERIFRPHNNKPFSDLEPRYVNFGEIICEEGIIDEVLCTLFSGDAGYTGEDSAEISCHGSSLIQQQIITLLVENGARIAQGGEFTLRAFRNGKFDLAQAEAVADLIAADSNASRDLALMQMRGGYSSKIQSLRNKLVHFASLIELELDFSEEDVEFADRRQLATLLDELKDEIITLASSFSKGNVMKTGIPVAIIGKPNVGKSTLLNAILNEERAIVSEIPGTTRDVIEDTININGFSFRFIDTAGLHDTGDTIESMGIERTVEKIRQAEVILHIFDISETNSQELQQEIEEFREHLEDKSRRWILVANKTDMLESTPTMFKDLVELETVFVCAKRKENISMITDMLSRMVEKESISDRTIVSNTRHYEALMSALEAIEEVERAFEMQVPSDLIAIDIRRALHYLGSITGEVTTEEILGTIFGEFCIGK